MSLKHSLTLTTMMSDPRGWGRVLYKALYMAAPPWGATPYPFVYHIILTEKLPFHILLTLGCTSLGGLEATPPIGFFQSFWKDNLLKSCSFIPCGNFDMSFVWPSSWCWHGNHHIPCRSDQKSAFWDNSVVFSHFSSSNNRNSWIPKSKMAGQMTSCDVIINTNGVILQSKLSAIYLLNVF